MTEKIQEVLLVGTGAIGGLYGGKLQQAGPRVSALCRSDIRVVKERGIRVSSPWGDFHFVPETVAGDAGDIQGHPDVILVALKVLPEVPIPQIIGPAVGPETVICLIQNGVEIEQEIAVAFPANEIISGLAFVCVSRMAHGVIRHMDYGRLVLGKFPAGLSKKARELANLFESTGVPCTVSERVETDRWEKLVWNASFSPLSVLGGGVDTREILECGQGADLAREVMEEVCRLARANGHALADSVVEKNLEDTRKMKPYKTSMCLDFEAGRPMEVEAILGNAVRAARRVSLEVLRLEALYALLSLVDTRIRRKIRSHGSQAGKKP